jgi:hypothetical protein
MRFLLPILLFCSLWANSQSTKLQVIKSDAVPTGTVKKLTIINSDVPASSGQIKIRLANGSYFFLHTLLGSGYTFPLLRPSVTSAGVYKPNGQLTATVWNNVTKDAGTHNVYWDGKDDFGNTIADTVGYYAQVVSNNLTATWEGGIGNTSDSLSGPSKWRASQGVYDMAFAGDYGYACLNYTESQISSYKFNVNTPQNKISINYGTGSLAWGASAMFVATDGNLVYWASTDPNDLTRAYVIVNSVNNDSIPATMAFGTTVTNTHSRGYSSVIDTVLLQVGATPSGIAVQKTGNYLFVAHGGMNRIDVLNKTTGASVLNITTLTNPRSLCVDTAGNLWVIHTFDGLPKVEKFTVNSGTGAITSTGVSLSGLLSPLRLGVSPDNTAIVVADGSTSQQLKAYNNSSGSYMWTHGQAGGYQSDPTVYNDKFYLVDRSGYTNLTFQTFIAFQPNGSFWVGDAGNYRYQHFAANRAYIDNIMYFPRSYAMAVDHNNPTRVFNGYMEYLIDYSKKLDNGVNGSWTFVRQWRDGVPNAYGTSGYEYDMDAATFKNLTMFPNGRTYALLTRRASTTPLLPYRQYLFELPSSGNLRNTGLFFDPLATERTNIMPDGSLKLFNTSTYTWTTRSLTGYDGSNNPIWGTATALSNLNTINVADIKDYGDNTVFTSNGYLAAFDYDQEQGLNGLRYHMAGIKIGDTAYRYKTAKATFPSYSGDFPDDGGFDIGNNVNYAGGTIISMDSIIAWNFRGENWKNGQTAKWNMYHDKTGLMISQFGVANYEFPSAMQNPPALHGNIFDADLIKVNGKYYLYHQEEGPHSQLVRWAIDSINTIAVHRVNITRIPPVSSYVDLMASMPEKGATFTSGTGGWAWPAIGSTDSSVRKITSGLKTYKRGEHGIQTLFQKPLSKDSITIDLGTVNSATWEILGDVNYDGHTVTWNAADNAYVEVLDASLKIINRFQTSKVDPFTTTPIDAYVNTVKMFSAEHAAFTAYSKRFRQLKITKSTLKYGDYPETTYSTPITTGANMNAPKYLRIYYYNTNAGDSRTKKVNINNLKIKLQ